MPALTTTSVIDTFMGASTAAGARDSIGAQAKAEAAVALTYGASLTPDCNTGTNRKVTMTGGATLNAPTNPSDGMSWQGVFLASGADRALTLNAAIKIPSGFSTISNPVTITSGQRWLVQLQYNADAAAWWLTGWMGGFA